MYYFVPYAYDRMPDGKPREGVAPERLGSKARCDVLLDIIEKNKIKWCCFILSAGYTKDSPTQATTNVPRAIASEMAHYIYVQRGVRNLFTPCIVLEAEERVWGTLEETVASVIVILRRQATEKNVHNKIERIYIATNPGHMLRVWLCWMFIAPPEWDFKFVAAKHTFTTKEWFQETVKCFRYIPILWKLRYKKPKS